MAIVFELKGKEAISDVKEFCRLKDGLTYIGRYADKETSEVIQGEIVQYGGKFYSDEMPFHSGFGCSPADSEGMVTTSLELFDVDYVPGDCKPLGDCPIRINVWNTAIDDEGPIACYAFYGNQLEEAKNVVRSNDDVDIFVSGKETDKKDFLES